MSLEYLNIDDSEEKGSLEGYSVDSTAEQIPNWLSSRLDQKYSEALVSYIRDNYQRVAIFKNLNVEEENRGQGIGSQLLEEAISEAASDIIMLVSDAYEEQQEGFKLQVFYERRDFAVVLETGAGPLMVYPSEQAIILKNVIESFQKPKI